MITYYNILLPVLIAILVINTRAWSFSNLLMAGTHATMQYADSVAVGAQKGLDECRSQFAWDRWNCPEYVFSGVFSRKRDYPANREMAFVQAIISAGIAHTVTQNCSKGQYDNCGCDKDRRDSGISRKNFRWSGCSDNVEHGFNVAKNFLDVLETGHDIKAFITLHNNNVGRLAVRNTMNRICKCHGVSGSCSMKTCWMKVADFRRIGDYLKRAYRNAIDLNEPQENENAMDDQAEGSDDNMMGSNGASRGSRSSGTNSVADSNSPRPLQPSLAVSVQRGERLMKGVKLNLESSAVKMSDHRLVFSDPSPDYCGINHVLGSNGTVGRVCSRARGKGVTREERRSCKMLCRSCGLTVKKKRTKVQQSCNCKFKWCCQVKCDSCIKEQLTLTCS